MTLTKAQIARLPLKPPDCNGCVLRDHGQGFAWGDGSPTSDLWFIGEALGENEALEGKPFVGGSGRYLNRLMLRAGIRREDVYLTNTLRCRPPNNEIYPWLPKAADHCSQFLDRDFSAHRPKVIVAVGGVTLQRLTGSHRGVYADRGYVFVDMPLPGIRTIATLHPAELLRAANVREKKQSRHREAHESIVVADLRKAREELTKPPFRPELEVARTIEDVERWITNTLANADHVAVDIEAHGDVIICIGFGYQSRGMCIPLVGEDGRRFWGADEVRALRLISDVFTNGAITKVFHNGYAYDVPELRKRGFVIVNWADTMVMHHTKYSELPHKLRFLGSVYTRMSPWKSEAKEAMEDELDK